MSEHDAIEQLAALLAGDEVPDATASPVGALADLATAVRDHADLVAPTPEFRSSLRAQVVAAADAPPGLVERTRTTWARRTANLRTSARVAVATVTASSMIGSAGVAVAAQEALPGDALHGLKTLTEDARLLLAADGVAEARLHLAFARQRLEELRATAGELDTDRVVALLAEMDAHSEAGAGALLDGVPLGSADTDEVRRFAAGQRHGLVSVFNDLPLLAKPVAEDSLELLRRIEATADGVASRGGTDPAAGNDRAAGDDQGTTPDGSQPAGDGESGVDLGPPPVDFPDTGVQAPVPEDPAATLDEELPGSTDRPESSEEGTSQDDTEDADPEPEPEPEPDQEREPEPTPGDQSLEPTDEVVEPEVDPDEGDGGKRGLDTSTSVSGLTGDEVAGAVEDTAAEADTVGVEDVADPLLQD